MEAILTLPLLLGLVFTPGLYAQGGTGTTARSSTLQPWLVGLAAVLGFLGVVFVGSLINRFFFSNKRKDDEDDEAKRQNMELRVTPNIYDNLVVDTSDEGPSDKMKTEDNKLTSL
nr:small integral membrane protein 24 [Pogona vitticeps]